ncbi:glycoside hydrolase superfamily [Mycotypha africana]|uniref:glycoside hydrolase superfamily n=1 Tax=Mycotypha africana TaxID=64632 RepID=UPI0022FFF64E|nr:glycoside hydrolase superfamily [Mycotypha africana]KAI8973444.1 glycoside hydrolase superfamily [Mycotypha africana]
MGIGIKGRWFTEPDTNRTLLFRGVNLSPNTKLPVGIPSHKRESFWVDYDRHVTFVGRPFPLSDADEHLQRLVNLGFNLLRFIVTWEAIEHEGPGIYDEDYLDYVVQVLKKCEEYRLQVYIDPHQDTWSRHCGGSGHPGWTLALAGLNPLHFPQTNAAIVHNLYSPPENFPKMIWNTNYNKLAAATLFTLFYAGRTYAPKCIVNGVNIQDYLQDHYLSSLTQLAKRIHDNHLEDTVVIGYDTMNEPGKGYLSVPNLSEISKDDVDFKKGLTPTAFQGMLLGAGFEAQVGFWELKWNGPRKTKDVWVKPDMTAWMTDQEVKEAYATFRWERDFNIWPAGCVWATHGVWDPSHQDLLRPDYFVKHPKTGQPTHYNDFWTDHLLAYERAIRHIHENAILFVQPPVLEAPPKLPANLNRVVYAPHWYDGLTLIKKKWCNYNVDYINLSRGKYGSGPLRFLRALRVGEKAIRQCFVDQLETIRKESIEIVGDYPCVIGEIGIPYDMEKSTTTTLSHVSSFWYWILSLLGSSNTDTLTDSQNAIGSPQSDQNKAFDANINALEKNLLNFTLWNYMPDNSAEWGDLWNGEDLSIFQSSDNNKSTDDASVITKQTNSFVKSPYADVSVAVTNDTIISSTDSLQGLLQQYQQESNVRNLISLHRPHPYLTAGYPLNINFVSPTEKICASFEYSFEYKSTTHGPTEIYVPSCYFPVTAVATDDTELTSRITVSVGTWQAASIHNQYWILLWSIEEDQDITEVKITIEGITVI